MNTYRKNEEFNLVKDNGISRRSSWFIISHIGNYHGNTAVFGKKWIKSKRQYSKNPVYITYFNKEDTFDYRAPQRGLPTLVGRW